MKIHTLLKRFGPMYRRTLLTALCTAGTVGIAGCGMFRSETTIADPTVDTRPNGRHTLTFTSSGEDIGSLSVIGDVESETITLLTDIWHRKGTHVQSIKLRVWMPSPQTDSTADIAVISPVEGDDSPPRIHLYTPSRRQGTIIEVTHLDDLKDETISTLDLMIRPHSRTATTLMIDSMIELTSSGWGGSSYTLDGQLPVEFPDLKRQ